MPFAYPHPYDLKPAIAARVLAGEALMAVCAQPGWPSYGSVYAWARADAAFGAQLADARRRGAWRRRWFFDEAVAQALLARLAEGQPITAVLRDPAMPSRRVYAYWRATQAHFQEEVCRLKAVHARERARRLHHRRYRMWDQALADRIVARVARGDGLARVLAGDPALPSRGVVRRWQAEHPEFDRVLAMAVAAGRGPQRRVHGRCTPELTAAITGAIRRGASLSSLGRTPGLPCATTLSAWMRTRPEFAARVTRACLAREELFSSQALSIAEAATPETVRQAAAQVGALRRQVGRMNSRIGGLREG